MNCQGYPQAEVFMKARFMLTYRQWDYARRHQCFRNFAYVIVVAIILWSLALLLIGCAKPPAKSGKGGSRGTTITTPSTVLPTSTPTPKPPVITLQVIGCPSTLALNWDGLVGTKNGVNKVQTVMCGSLEGNGSFDALIDVRYYTPDARLDYYVYNNLFRSSQRSFSMLGLLNGDAQISPAGTIMTAEIGPGDAVKGPRDVFKEYQWNGATFEQILFPGMYPDMTYYQAEKDQAQLNAELAAGNKRDAWKATFSGVANDLAKRIFHWPSTHFSAVNFSNHDGIYIGAVTNLGPGGGGFVARMFHLDNNIGNIFEIQQVTSLDGNTSLISPTTGAQLTDPISVRGSALASSSVLGKVVVYSDTLIALGDSGDIPSPAPRGYVNFTKSVTYHLNSTGVQEGLVAFYSTNQNNSNLSNQVVMVKVFLVA
jgi:hypothetical protein